MLKSKAKENFKQKQCSPLRRGKQKDITKSLAEQKTKIIKYKNDCKSSTFENNTNMATSAFS